MHGFDSRRVQDAVDKLIWHKTRVVPFAVVADPEIEDVDIFVTVAGIHVEKKKALNTTNSTTSSQTESTSVSDFSMTISVASRGIHGNKQPGMFADKANAKARAIVSLFAVVKIVDGSGKQALYLGHFGLLRVDNTGYLPILGEPSG